MPSGWRRGFGRKSETEVDKATVATASSDASQSAKETQPLGLKLLVEGENPTVDIVAVHGLNGSHETTWTAKNNVRWLQDKKMLPAKIPNARIFSWGYDANTHSTHSLTAMYLYDHAQNLVSDLSLERRLTKTERRPIIFIAHSLGGIVVKSALIHSNMAHSRHLKDHKAIKTSTYGIIFMGTPHQGGEGILWGQRLVNVASIVMHTNDNLIKVLAKDSETLQSQLAQYAPISSDFVTKFAYETYPMRIAKFGEMIIVPKSSAVVPGAVDTEAIAIMADHKNMAKFTSENDDGYKKISGHLMLMVEEARERVARNWEQETELQNATCGTIKPEFHVPFDMKGIPRTSAFVGRESYLDNMIQHLSPTSAARRRRICVLHGLGGIGKTQLAIEYARLHKNEYSSFFFIDGKTEESLIQSLLSIASRLPQARVPGFDAEEVCAIEDSKRKAQEVLRWFALEGNGAWLLVYDNVDKTSYGAPEGDIESQSCYNIEDFLPGGDAGAIIITSRVKHLAKLGEQVHVRKIDTLSGVAILEKQSGKSFRRSSHSGGGIHSINDTTVIDPDALALVERLDGLPLALVIAGSYMSRTSISKYLEFYTSSWNSLQESPSFSPDYPGRTIITTWKISYDELKRKHEGAVKLLRLWAYLDNRDVWYELFKWPSWDDQAPDWLLQVVSTEICFLDAINMLLDYSLAEKNEGEASYSMHAVVHDWIREIVNQDDNNGMYLKWAVGSVGLLADWALRSEEQDSRTLEVRILSHAARIVQHSFDKAVLRYNSTSSKGKGGGYFLKGLRGLGHIFCEYCMFRESELIFRRLLWQEEQLNGVDSLPTFHTLRFLGDVYTNQGKYREAEVVYQQVLEGYEKLLGLENILTLSSVLGLARVFLYQGKSQKAKALSARAIKGKEELCAKDDLSILELETLGKIFAMYFILGMMTDAEKIFKKVLIGYEKIRGKGHQDTLRSAWDLGLFYDIQERYDEAELQFLRVFRGREELFGKDHILTLKALRGLGTLYNHMKRFEEAEKTLRHVLDREEELLGDDHKLTLNTLEDLGTFLFLQERYVEAEPIYQRAVSGAEKTFGRDHVVTLAYLHDLGLIYAQQGKKCEAEVAYERVLAGRKKIFDEEHELILDVIHDLGVLYVAQGREAEAEEYLYRAWTLREKVLGSEHFDTEESAVNIYNLWLSQGYYANKNSSEASSTSLRFIFSWISRKNSKLKRAFRNVCKLS